MTFVLNGGGGAAQTAPVDLALARELPRRTMLYVPHATAPDPWSFDQALDWLRGHSAFDDLQVEMWPVLENRRYSDLDDFDAIYLMGGNTYTLLHALRVSGFEELLAKFINSNRVVCGISAGAIVLGHDIGTAAIGDEADENTVGITDLSGLNALSRYSVHTHYADTDRSAIEAYLARETDPRGVVCIPEDAGVRVRGAACEVLGGSPIVHYDRRDRRVIDPGAAFTLDATGAVD